MHFREFRPSDDVYAASWRLRREVLLDPFGIEPQLARADDEQALHLGLFDGVDCLACLLLVPRRAGTIQMRQVAVVPTRQRTGLGRRLVEQAEALALERGFQLMLAHARRGALPFYLALGYENSGPEFEEVGIRHQMVRRVLTNRS